MSFSRLGSGHAFIELSPSPERPSPALGVRHGASVSVDISSKATAGTPISKRKESAQREVNGNHDQRSIIDASDIIAAKRTKHEREVDQPVHSSTGKEADACSASAIAPGRSRSRKLVCDKLTAAFAGSANSTAIADEIEEALHKQLGEGKEYVAQARAILFNLKTGGIGSLKQKLLEGRCDLKQLPRMTGDELLSDAKSSEKATAQRKAAEATMVKPVEQQETDMFTCDSCSSTRTKFNRTAELRSYGAQQKMVSVSHVTCISCGNTWITR
eukprot:TRINITY_DN15616_c0_g1_i1.p1 TRINITY_DN15616_c0_g1~~TRINITY_DN15616_c0_g1_i1.p1  ORF type:complete len:272 (+),score=48.90 TRINITY_DN15616_c0_g1_i1:42-857(+)